MKYGYTFVLKKVTPYVFEDLYSCTYRYLALPSDVPTSLRYSLVMSFSAPLLFCALGGKYSSLFLY